MVRYLNLRVGIHRLEQRIQCLADVSPDVGRFASLQELSHGVLCSNALGELAYSVQHIEGSYSIVVNEPVQRSSAEVVVEAWRWGALVGALRPFEPRNFSLFYLRGERS